MTVSRSQCGPSQHAARLVTAFVVALCAAFVLPSSIQPAAGGRREAIEHAARLVTAFVVALCAAFVLPCGLQLAAGGCCDRPGMRSAS